ncbi:hypothetical protein A2982_01835 [candidate division WWE3 bacterium RIFCSPLOWO2_01_FULL_39_13]|uniref:Uncharacterized protein n=1 Tax=candidate division WWE3 bacterium RIFCSPLOWO2_01_FULL_39_13 TaxID=1802624 RepID=A0A1F4V225_UNCKA|nr:MAG: hypothetical protein A2982_01835 [candidate division WWE3 bacterium RIFCSPLOWO2_01_FULL_39_13]
MKRLKYVFYTVLPVVLGFLSASRVYGAIDASDLDVKTSIGNIENLAQVFVFAFNLLRYVGWAGVILGIGWAIFALIYKLFGTESEETMKAVSGNITKAVIIVICGILLLSAGFIVKNVGSLLGVPDPEELFSVPEELSG